MKETKACLWLLIGMIGAFQPAVWGQDAVLSNIRGNVTDAKGAAIPGAAVTALNQNTGFTRATKTAQDGDYLFNDIVSGIYTITVEVPGFKKYIGSGIGLTASRTLRVDVAMQVGDLVQTVEVTGGAPVIETESPTLSFSARNEIMNEIPMEGSTQGGRIPNTYFYIVPGNSMSVGKSSFNGLPSAPGAMRLTLDGVRVAASCCQIIPSLEMLDEMKVITNNASAEYATPSTVQMITRQGSNAYHGDAWELFDDKSLQARNPFLVAKQVSHGHTFGGSIGGPVLKNKLFFYAGYEGVRLNNTAITAQPLTPNNLPTAKMQQGDFSELLTPAFVSQFNQGQTVAVRDPLTGLPFANNVIPPNRISGPATSLIQKFWTVPTAPGLTANQFSNVLHPFQRDKGDLRVDYNLSSRHTIYGRYGQTALHVALPTAPFTAADSGNRSQLFPSHSASFSDTFIFSPAVTNEFRVGLTRTLLAFSSALDTTDVMGAAGIQAAGITGIPGLAFSGIGSFTGVTALSLTVNTNQVLGFTDHVSYFSGKHSFKAGVQFNREQVFTANRVTPPTFSFNGNLSGWSWADFMLGLPSTFTSQLAATNYYLFDNELGVFAQDEYRVSPRLTLQFGLRYQVWSYPHEKYDKLAVFDPKSGKVVVPSEQSLRYVVPNFPQAQIPVVTASQASWGGNTSALINNDMSNIAPRIGFAWRPFDKGTTVVRGGYGIYYYNVANGTAGADPTSAAFLASQTATQQLGSGGVLNPTLTLSNPFAAFGGTSTSLNPQTLSFSAVSPNLRNAMVQEYNFTLERESHGWGARASYLGFFQTRMPHVVNINEAPPSNLPFSQSRRPVPTVFNINLTENGGFARNNAFQFELQRPTTHGFFLSAAYTYMKNITDINSDFGGNTPTVPIVGTGGNYNRNQRFKSNTNFTPRQQVILTYSYELPFGTGKAFLGNAKGVVNQLAGGWKVVGVTEFQSGLFLTPYYVGVDPAGSTPGTGQQLPDRVGDGNLSHGQRNPFSGKPFFDTAAFVCPGGISINGQANLLTAGCPLSTPQNVGRFGNSSPTIIQGPGINIWNLSVIKQFKLPREGMHLDFAAQFSNPWNHPNWEMSPNVNLSSAAAVGRFTATRNQFIEPFAYGNRKITFNLRLNF